MDSLNIDFPTFEPPSPASMKVTECWQLSDGSIIWKIEGQYVAELPKAEVIEAQLIVFPADSS